MEDIATTNNEAVTMPTRSLLHDGLLVEGLEWLAAVKNKLSPRMKICAADYIDAIEAYNEHDTECGVSLALFTLAIDVLHQLVKRRDMIWHEDDRSLFNKLEHIITVGDHDHDLKCTAGKILLEAWKDDTNIISDTALCVIIDVVMKDVGYNLGYFDPDCFGDSDTDGMCILKELVKSRVRDRD